MAKRYIINTWSDLQENVNTIIKSLNADQNLIIAAASNPILALRELGYDINPDILGFVEDKMRFKTKQVAQLKKLRSEIHKKSGIKFNIRSKEELEQTLFENLDLKIYDKNGCLISQELEFSKKTPHKEDPLNAYAGLHPVIEPLLSFRKIDSTTTGFCDEYTYQKIRRGNYGKDSNVRLKIRLKKQ